MKLARVEGGFVANQPIERRGSSSTVLKLAVKRGILLIAESHLCVESVAQGQNVTDLSMSLRWW